MHRVLIGLILLFTTGACGERGDSALEEMSVADAPLDTLGRSDVPVAISSESGALADTSLHLLTLNGFPPPGELRFVRYRNETYRYSIAYPDSILRPADPVDDGRGMTFISSSGDVRMIVYAEEQENYDDLNDRYDAAVGEPGARITYQARDEGFYVVSGRQDDLVFYEKALVDGETIRTFRIRYPAAGKVYYDAVTALIAASFDGRS